MVVERDQSAEDDHTLMKPGLKAPLWICAILLSLYAFYISRTLVVPVITAVFAYLTLRPLVRKLRRLGIPSSLAAAGIMCGLVLAVALGFYVVFEPAKQMAAEAPENMEIIKDRLKSVFDQIETINRAKDELTEEDEELVPEEEKPVPVEIQQPAWSTNLILVSGTGNVISFISIASVLLYFLLATGDEVLRTIMGVLPNFRARRKLFDMLESVQDGLSSYLAQVSAINICLGIAVGFAMWFLGMPSPMLWGVMATTFNFIPIVGALAGAVLIFFVALINFEQVYYCVLVMLTFLTLTSIEGQFITPTILGRSMKMSPVLVFLSIVFWGWIWGLMGVFLSVPILIALRMAAEQYEAAVPISAVLGAEGAHQVSEGDALRNAM